MESVYLVLYSLLCVFNVKRVSGKRHRLEKRYAEAAAPALGQLLRVGEINAKYVRGNMWLVATPWDIACLRRSVFRYCIMARVRIELFIHGRSMPHVRIRFDARFDGASMQTQGGVNRRKFGYRASREVRAT